MSDLVFPLELAAQRIKRTLRQRAISFPTFLRYVSSYFVKKDIAEDKIPLEAMSLIEKLQEGGHIRSTCGITQDYVHSSKSRLTPSQKSDADEFEEMYHESSRYLAKMESGLESILGLKIETLEKNLRDYIAKRSIKYASNISETRINRLTHYVFNLYRASQAEKENKQTLVKPTNPPQGANIMH